jgi:hypothetical protein
MSGNYKRNTCRKALEVPAAARAFKLGLRE